MSANFSPYVDRDRSSHRRSIDATNDPYYVNSVPKKILKKLYLSKRVTERDRGVGASGERTKNTEYKINLRDIMSLNILNQNSTNASSNVRDTTATSGGEHSFEMPNRIRFN